MTDNGGQAKMSGYLEKKGKMRMVSSWKKYWFVLEARLLLYYRSKDEYDAISPCKGSINLGPPCSVKSCPSLACAFQIETRASTITLRADNGEDQKKWMQAIMAALNQNQSVNPESTTRLSHFRYSLDDLVPKSEPCDTEARPMKFLERQNTMPNRLKTPSRTSNEIIQRLQKIGAQSYGGSLGAITKATRLSNPLPKGEVSASQCSLASTAKNRSGNSTPVRRSVSNLRLPKDNIYERISGDSTCSQYSGKLSNFMVDNDNYSVPIKKRNSEPVSVLIENEQYCSVRPADDEVIYAEPKINEDYNKNSLIVENSCYERGEDVRRVENEYEDLDKYSVTPESSVKGKNRKKFNMFSRDDKKSTKEKPLKKSQSFIKRVWNRRNKKQEKIEDEEEIYEEVDRTAVEKLELVDGSAVQMLSELQNILENKKPFLKKTISNQSSIRDEDEAMPEPETDYPLCPSLPPKHPNPPDPSPYHDVPANNRPLVEEPVRSLDEILQDLNIEKVEPKTKVKMLIEKFNESDDDVTLRNRPKSDQRSNRHSDDLNRLLDELTKVTQAPIMTPGVTSSLINPNLTDEQWLKLLPIRQRRLSEPDYDIPRPHKSIQSLKKEQFDSIPATRFFGPVLPPNFTETKDDSLSASMTPDSLEIEGKLSPLACQECQHNQLFNDLRCFSQTTYNDDAIIYSMPKPYVSVATHIVNTCQNICSDGFNDEHTIIYKNVRNIEVREEVFKDSLELCPESFTEF